jgi:hypothetical protein
MTKKPPTAPKKADVIFEKPTLRLNVGFKMDLIRSKSVKNKLDKIL